MLNNKVRFSHDIIGKDLNRVTAEEAELVSKALYTGHAVFWNDGVTMLNYNYAGLNIVPDFPIDNSSNQLS